MITKAMYTEVAQIINHEFRKHDQGEYKPRVSVINTLNHGFGYDKWSLALNHKAQDLVENHQGKPQDMFYADEIYVVDNCSSDLYIEPINSGLGHFGLARY